MARINNFTTRTKLILGFGIILVLLVIITVTACVNLTAVTRSVKYLREVNFETIIQLQQLRNDQNYTRAQTLYIMLVTDPVKQSEAESLVQQRFANMDTELATVSALNPTDLELQSDVQKIRSAIADYRQTQTQEITLVKAWQVQEAIKLADGVGTEQYEAVRTLAVQMGDDQIAFMDQQLAADQQAARSATLLMVVIGAIALVLTVVLVVILNRTIAIPLNTISGVAEKISAGDLTVNVADDGRSDEVGILARAFRLMVETLRRMMADTSKAVGMLGSSASEILTSTTQVASGSAETASAINETTTTVEEVRQAAQLSSKKAQSVSENAHRVAQASQSGKQAVEDTFSAMERIREQMNTISQTVVRLSEQSQSIGGIIATVTDLADQSNLLAVNAAIEAARAGEQGKSFAIVAQEIKSLAVQSKQATEQVRSILGDVQKATSNAVMATEQGSKAVEAGVKQALQAGEAIRALAEASDEAVQAAVQIVASGQQQVVGMDQIGAAMENINQAGAQNAASMTQMETAAQNLHQLGAQLKELVAQFRV